MKSLINERAKKLLCMFLTLLMVLMVSPITGLVADATYYDVKSSSLTVGTVLTNDDILYINGSFDGYIMYILSTSGSATDKSCSAYGTSFKISDIGYTEEGKTIVGYEVKKIETTSGSYSTEITLQAKTAEYSITYELDGGDNNSLNPETYTSEDVSTEALTLADPTKAGYSFVKWVELTGDGAIDTTGIPVGSTGDKTFKAIWSDPIEYTISYHNVDGITGTNTNPVKYTVNSETINLSFLSKPGYSFTHWSSDSNGNITCNSIPKGSTGNKNLYANWTPVSYKLSYDLNASSDTVTPASITGTEFTCETTEAILVDTIPMRTGYTFGGWYSNAAGTGNEIENDADLKALATSGTESTIILYAKWLGSNYTINYDLNAGSDAVSPSSITATTFNYSDASIALTSTTPTRAGYTFGGWYSDSSCTGSAIANTATAIKGLTYVDKATTVYAKWTPITYKINYDLNAGSDIVTPESITATTFNYSDASIALTTTTPTRTGYAFGGWYSNAAGTGSKIETATAIKGLSYNSSNETTVYAKWTPADYTITYNNVDGITNPNPTGYKVNELPITLQSVSKNGYTFDGWYDNQYLWNDPITGIAIGSSGNKEFWAKWTPVQYDIVYELDNGTNNPENPAKYTIESTVVLKAPTKSGYTFVEWQENGIASTGIVKGSTGTKTFTAIWQENTVPVEPIPEPIVYYNITYVLNGGINNENNPASYTKDDEIILAAPIKDGYTFVGWYADADLTIPVRAPHIAKGSTGDKTFYAKWSMNVVPVMKENNNNGYKLASLLTSKQIGAYISGYTDGTVRPDGNMTRAEAAAVMSRLHKDFGESHFYMPDYDDVSYTDWYAKYVGFIQKKGIADVQSGDFRPNEYITRAEFCTMLAKLLGVSSDNPVAFADVVDNSAAKYIQALYELGYIGGYPNGEFRPDNSITRAEVVKIVNLAIGRTGDGSGIRNPYSDLDKSHWAYGEILKASIKW